MTDSLPQPCARWANLLAAHPDTLSAAERRALDAHVASCRACAAVRADYQRMDARIRSLPDPRRRPDLPPWLLVLQATETRDAPAPRSMMPFYSLENHMHIRKEPGLEMPTPTLIRQGRSRRRRAVSWVMAVAALVVIALITTALLVSHSGTPATTGIPKSTTTPTAAGSQGWQTVPGLTHLSAQPFIAPSNPQIIYLLGYQLGSHPITLERSDDGGAHWKTLPLPNRATQSESSSFTINADNAQNIFFLMSFELSSSACSGGQASSGPVNAYSGYSCEVPYYSADGGAHWGLMHCLSCASTPYTSGGLAPVGNIVAQGNHLYSSFYDQNQHERLIASTDAGATWQPADRTLLTQGQGICGFGAVPRGSSVYALVQSGYCAQAVGYLNLSSAVTHPKAQSGLAIWRSDDAGAHWSRVGSFPYQQPDTAVFRAIDTGGAQPTLFGAAGQGASYTRLMSTNGGKTWQPLPTQGIPASAALLTPQAALSDGSLLTEVQETFGGPTTFYALKPGSQTWQKVAPALDDDPTELVVSSAGGHDTLWAVTTNHQSDFSVVYYTLR